MAITKFLALFGIFFSSTIHTVISEKHEKTQGQNGVDKLLDNVVREIPKRETNELFSQMLKNQNRNVLKQQLIISPARDESPTKKSTEAIPDADVGPAISVALAKPTVYIVESKPQVESKTTEEYKAEKRFVIPQSTAAIIYKQATHSKDEIKPFQNNAAKNKASLERKTTIDHDDSFKDRIKRQEGAILNNGLPILGPLSGNSIQELPVQAINTILPARSSIGDVGVQNDGINSNKFVAMIPVKINTPLTIATPSSVAMVAHTPHAVQSEVFGTSRSNLGTTFIQTSPDISTKAPSILRTPNDRNLLVKLGDQQNRFTTTEQQESRLTPERENEAIKLAQIPMRLLSKKLETENSNKIINAEGESSGIKLSHFSTKNEVVERQGEKKSETNTKEDINTETLKSLQARLTNIISKLEAKVEKKEGQLKQKKKEASLSKIVQNKPSEKSLNFLKQRLNNVLKKFNSKPGAGQPFTIGKEWGNILGGTGEKHGNKEEKQIQAKKAAGLKKTKSKTKDEGKWPTIASQLLRKLNRALMKIQEQKVARSLGKEAVMYFSFDKVKSTTDDEMSFEDMSGHFNDASVNGRAYSSSRTYGSCGKALILNSGNLRFMDKYFRTKPTKAITLAMWVRTNVTGYVKWFARDSGPSREFSTRTQYPLVQKNVWTHLCGTFNSSTGITRIYVDGELKTEKVNRQQETIPADFTPAGIGPEFGDQNLIAADEVYMFARALNPREVRTLHDDCEFNRMVLHYGFQKINRTAGLVFDQSGLHNDGHLLGDARILDSGCEKCGSCLDLNAAGDPRLTIEAKHFKHKPTKAISIGAWFNLNATSGTHPLFSVWETVGKSTLLDLHVTDGKLQWKGYSKNGNVIFNMATSQAVIPEGIWVHILATFDSLHGQAKIFIDGHQKAVEETAKKVPIGEDWNEIRLGGHEARSQESGGYMDEFVLYNWELEPSEISYIMKYCPDHPKLVSFTVHVPLD